MTYDQIFLEVISIIIVLNAVIAPICKLWKGYPSWTYVIISWISNCCGNMFLWILSDVAREYALKVDY